MWLKFNLSTKNITAKDAIHDFRILNNRKIHDLPFDGSYVVMHWERKTSPMFHPIL